MTVRIFDDEGGVRAAELIGCAHVALKDLEPGKVKDVWLKLVKDLEVQRDNKNRGQVRTPNIFLSHSHINDCSIQTRYSKQQQEKDICSNAYDVPFCFPFLNFA